MSAPSRDGGVSVLAAMTGAVIASAPGPKPAKPRLGVLPGEVNGPSILVATPLPMPITPAAFPYDAPTDATLYIIMELERQRDSLTKVIEGLRLLAGDPEVSAADAAKNAEVTAKLIEKEADRRIKDAAEAAQPAPDKKDKAAVAVREKVVARVAEAEANPLEGVVTAAEARDRKRAMMLAAQADAGGDESFQDRMARLSEEAKTATFTHADAPNFSEPETDGWKCPTHKQAMTKTSARRNRDYQACPVSGCAKYEPL